MSTPLFHAEGQVLAREHRPAFPLNLRGDELARARKEGLRAGDRIAVVDAARDYFACEVVSLEGGLLTVSFARRDAPSAAEPSVVLAQGLVEDAKMRAIFRSGAEIGLAGFLPFACGRCGVELGLGEAGTLLEGWQSEADDAALHAGFPCAPRVHGPVDVEGACAALSGAAAVLVCWEEAPEAARLCVALEKLLPGGARDCTEAPLAVVVGPEGGLSQEEVDAFLSCNPRSSLVSLGPSVLRVETAALLAPAFALYSLGALGGAAAPGREGAERGDSESEARA